MSKRRKIYFTVTNDLDTDQRMIRICTSLAHQGYEIMLVGRQLGNPASPEQLPFDRKKLRCLFNKGFLFYAEYNVRLLVYLLFKKIDLVCAIDLDTVVPCYCISRIKKIPRVYDAHELFCEMKEVVTRPRVHSFWKGLEKYFVPRFAKGYTVSDAIAKEFSRMYGSDYAVIRNLPVLREFQSTGKKPQSILYQGAVNQGRCFETLIPAMAIVDAVLIICGDGNFLQQARALVTKYSLENKVLFEGRKSPAVLRDYTLNASIGVTLFENNGLSNYLSLGNRFFDYMHAGIPQLCVNFPSYNEINGQYEVALLINDADPASIAVGLNRLLHDEELYQRLTGNAMEARKIFNWQNEEKILIGFYRGIFEK